MNILARQLVRNLPAVGFNRSKLACFRDDVASLGSETNGVGIAIIVRSATGPSYGHGGCPERAVLIDLVHYNLEVVASPAVVRDYVYPSLTHSGTEVRLTIAVAVLASLYDCYLVVPLVVVGVHTTCAIESQEEVV